MKRLPVSNRPHRAFARMIPGDPRMGAPVGECSGRTVIQLPLDLGTSKCSIKLKSVGPIAELDDANTHCPAIVLKRIYILTPRAVSRHTNRTSFATSNLACESSTTRDSGSASKNLSFSANGRNAAASNAIGSL